MDPFESQESEDHSATAEDTKPLATDHINLRVVAQVIYSKIRVFLVVFLIFYLSNRTEMKFILKLEKQHQ